MKAQHLTLLSILVAPATAQVTTESNLLARAREAGFARAAELAHGIVMTGKCREGGAEGTFCWTLLNDGRFRLHTESALGYMRGFDGKRGWRVDTSGMPGALELRGLAVTRSFVRALNGSWLAAPKGDGATFALGEEATITLDEKTAEPKTIQLPNGTKIEFAGWGESSRLRHPKRFTRTGRAGAQDWFEVTKVRAATRAECALGDAITKRPEDTTFGGELPATVVLERAPSGHLLVHPKVEGQQLGWFILDTGAGRSCIDKSSAEKNALETLGTVTAQGVGGSVAATWRKGKSLELGPVRIEDPVFVELDLGFLTKHFGRRIGGILGYDFLSRCLVEIDLQRNRLTLDRPGAWKEREAPWVNVRFSGNIPAVTCKVESVEGLFALDTGASGNATIHASFVRKHKLLEGRDTKAMQHGGVGGMIPARRGKLASFELAGMRFEDTTAVFSQGAKGYFAESAVAGNVGTGYLGRFVMLIDYPNRRIGFVPQKG